MNAFQVLKSKQIELMSTESDLGGGLQFIADTQVVVSMPVQGAVPPVVEQLTKDNIRTYFLAMIGEVIELLQTLDWKPWKTKTDLDKDRVIDEFADVLAFLGLIVYYLNLLGISSKELADGYNRKSIVNIDRFLGNDDPRYRQPSLFEELEK